MGELLWQPSESRICASRMYAFARLAESRSGLSFPNYDSLHRWSVEHSDRFWSLIRESGELRIHGDTTTVRIGQGMRGTRWFPGARLNFAENLLRYTDDQTALIGVSENGETVRISYRELNVQARAFAAFLHEQGIVPGDRVAGYLPNIPEAVMAMLGTTLIGAVWSSCSPDFGVDALVDRFGQIEPRILVTATGNQYMGKEVNTLERAIESLKRIPSICTTVVVTRLGSAELQGDQVLWGDIMNRGLSSPAIFDGPFDHPVYIMYSSGTTGKPKCLVHGAGGTLLQHYKELALHTDISRLDVVFYYTTCGWMMWNWLVSSLSLGATVVLYDGAPAFPGVNRLWELAETERITIFGTSPKFLSTCGQAGRSPGKEHNLISVRTILSTGSPLAEDQFRWVYGHVGTDLHLASISGGTDILSCFMLGVPLLPVHAGEIQAAGLGMDIHAFDEGGKRVIDQVGELVCTSPFPSMPVSFWNDPDGKKYHAAYFAHYPNIWRHGDYIRKTGRGSVIVYGRSDATLNPGGVRIGTAEIYAPVEQVDGVIDSLVIGQQFQGDIRIVLFVVLREGVTLSDGLADSIRAAIRAAQSPRHVPACIMQVSEIPRTISGKKVELAVVDIIHGRPVQNREALANPHALDQFVSLREQLC